MHATLIPVIDPVQFIAALALLIFGILVVAGVVELARRGLRALGPLFGVAPDENWSAHRLADD